MSHCFISFLRNLKFCHSVDQYLLGVYCVSDSKDLEEDIVFYFIYRAWSLLKKVQSLAFEGLYDLILIQLLSCLFLHLL